MVDLQQDRIGGGEPGPIPKPDEEQYFDHIALGYTNRTTLDDFIDGESGDLVVRGPFHAGESVNELRTLGSSVTQGTPCLVVPLIHERMTEIRREVNAAIGAFQSRWEPDLGAERPGAGRAGEEKRADIRSGGRARSETSRGAERGAPGEARAAKGRGTGTERGQPRAARSRQQGRPRTYGETGGTARGTSSGAIRKGSTGPSSD